MTVRGLAKGIGVAAAGLVTTALIAAAAVCLGSGCSMLAYYGQAAQGHLDLIERARPVKDWLDEPETSQSLRARLALTQVQGYLVLENGVYAFGVAMAQEMPVSVELGILLDVFVGVFVMGIIIFHISREFEHLETDRLSDLKDWES